MDLVASLDWQQHWFDEVIIVEILQAKLLKSSLNGSIVEYMRLSAYNLLSTLLYSRPRFSVPANSTAERTVERRVNSFSLYNRPHPVFSP